MVAGRVRDLSPVDAGYLAGLIDGEGTVALTRLHAGAHRYLVVTISSTEVSMLRWALETIGAGKITRKRTYSDRHSAAWTYALANRQALALLRQITPLLRSYKRARAELALAHYESLTPRNGRYDAPLLARREAFEREFLALTPNGKTPGLR